MARLIPQPALDLAKHFEGLELRLYIPPERPSDRRPNTIGYGHVALPHEDFLRGITEAEADALLAHDLSVAGARVEHLVAGDLTDGQFGALVDLAFNLGAGRLASSTLLRLLNRGDYDGAVAEFPKWCHIGTAVSSCLARRRAADAQLFATGAWP